jgi:hypothetical protein
VHFEYPDTLRLSGMGSLRFHIRATPGDQPLSLRWLANGVRGDGLLQRKVSVDEGAVWTLYDLPLNLWRWGNNQVGDWAETNGLTLAIESPVAEVFIDELHWSSGSPYPRPALYEEIAFGTRDFRSTERLAFRISSDSKRLKPEDMGNLLERLQPIVYWLKRVSGTAFDPTNISEPIVVLVFAEREEYVKFAKRLGVALRVTITPPGADGYAIQDIATSYYDEKLGADRPVLFHEAVHATVARILRLIPGATGHGWLQEGIANYLQLCQFPESLAIETYPKLFKEGVGARTTFLPLKTLLTSRIEMQHYAQLAVLTAWLIEKHSDWFSAIAFRLANGGDIETALKECETDFDAMQKEWLAWGQETFKEDPERKVHFELPAEWDK